ncbi:MAG: leucine-rich repeat domain-containing protein [Oscillospiraceae bacterium]|nr:leucine-rich repeat domain-containing protein [Oscillospiraceae bacterium]
MKKAIESNSLILALLMATLLLTACGGDDASPKNIPVNSASDFETSDRSGGVSIRRYIGDATEVNIPSTIQGAYVVSISDGAFENRSAITHIIIPDTVVSIGEQAFKGCSNLISITLPISLKRISHRAFAGCSSLNKIVIPNSVMSIESGAFKDCTSLESINLSDNLTMEYLITPQSDYSWFKGCENLTNAVFQGVKYSIKLQAYTYRDDEFYELPQEFYDAVFNNK